MNVSTNRKVRDDNGNIKAGPHADGDWSGLRVHAVQYCKEYMKHPSKSKRLNLAELVQFVTLKLSLHYLFPGQAILTDDTFEDIIAVGNHTNRLWIESKKPEEQRPQWKDQKDIHDALRRVFGIIPVSSRSSMQNVIGAPNLVRKFGNMLAQMSDSAGISGKAQQVYDYVTRFFGNLLGWPTEPGTGPVEGSAGAQAMHTKTQNVSLPDPLVSEQNPMNWILPAYKTMWRVVLRCFLEIRFRQAENGPKWSDVLETYLIKLKDPRAHEGEGKGRENAFRTPVTDGIAPIHIVKEALRLYPPTRRVNRVYNNKEYRADIEECQRFSILGEQPGVFRPERWQEICQASRDKLVKTEEEHGFVPFAFHCPAGTALTKGFGLKMIELLVATLCREIGEEWQVQGENGLLDREQPLSSDRAAYGDLELGEKL